MVKLNYAWLENKTALEMVFRQQIWLKPIGEWLANYPTFLKILTPIIVIFELVFPWFLLIPQKYFKTRLFVVGIFVGFQILLTICLELNFMPFVATSVLMVFLPSKFWDKQVLSNNRIKIDKIRLRNIIVLPLLIYLIGTFVADRFGKEIPMNSKAYSLGLLSVWYFYDYPPEIDYDYNIVVKLENGDSIKLLNSIHEKSNWNNPVFSELWQNYRFKYYLETVTFGNPKYTNYFLN